MASAHLTILDITARKGSSLWHLQRDTSHVPVARMLKDSWCPSEILRSLEQFSPALLYYITLLRSPTTTRGHSWCTDRKCFDFMVDDSTYRARYLLEHCNCSMMGPGIGTVEQIIKDGKIPLLAIYIDEHSDTMEIYVDEYDNSKEYIPISRNYLGSGRLVRISCHTVNCTSSSALDKICAQQSTWTLHNRGRADAAFW